MPSTATVQASAVVASLTVAVVAASLGITWAALPAAFFPSMPWALDSDKHAIPRLSALDGCQTPVSLADWPHPCVLARNMPFSAPLAASAIHCGQRIARHGVREWTEAADGSACAMVRTLGGVTVVASANDSHAAYTAFAHLGGGRAMMALRGDRPSLMIQFCDARDAVRFDLPNGTAWPACSPGAGDGIAPFDPWDGAVPDRATIELRPHAATVTVVVLLAATCVVLLAALELRAPQHVPALQHFRVMFGADTPNAAGRGVPASGNGPTVTVVAASPTNSPQPKRRQSGTYLPDSSDGDGDSVGPMSYEGSDDGDGGAFGSFPASAMTAKKVSLAPANNVADPRRKSMFGTSAEESEFNFDRPTVANVEDVFISCDLAWKPAATVVGVRVQSAVMNLVGRENEEAAEFLEGLHSVVAELAKKRDVRACALTPGVQSGLIFFGNQHAQRACRAAVQVKKAVARWNAGQPMALPSMLRGAMPPNVGGKTPFQADVSVGVSSGPACIGTSGQYDQTDTAFGLAVDALEHLLHLHPVLCTSSRTSILATAAVRTCVSILAEGIALVPVDLVTVPACLSANSDLELVSPANSTPQIAAQPDEQLPTAPLAAEPEMSFSERAGGSGRSEGEIEAAPPSVEYVYSLVEVQSGQDVFADLSNGLTDALDALAARDRERAVTAAGIVEEAFEEIETRAPFDAVAVDRALLSRVLRGCTELDEEGHVALFEISPALAVASDSVRARAEVDGGIISSKVFAFVPRQLLLWNVSSASAMSRDGTSSSHTALSTTRQTASASVGAWRQLLRSGPGGAAGHGSHVTLHSLSASAAAGHATLPGTVDEPRASPARRSVSFVGGSTPSDPAPSGGPATVTPATSSPGAGGGAPGTTVSDADLLEDELQSVIAEKERKAEEAAERAAAAAAAAADAAADEPADDDDGEGGGFSLFSFVPSAPPEPEAEEKEVEPKRFTDCRGAQWCLSSRMLGSGAFGNVFLGMGSEGQMVAIKAIKISVKSKEECKNVIKEIRLLGRLKSDRIVQYMASAVVGSFLMIVMEAVGGGSLLGVTQQYARLPQKLIVTYLRDCLGGVRTLHSNGIVHRDIKPHNVLITEQGRCKLADFGTACHVSYATASEKSGDITGTVIYMAPEACDGMLHVRSDVWSTGIMAYQLAMKALPYHHNDLTMPYAILSKLGKRDPKVFKPNTDDAPEWLKPLIDRALEFDPDLRPSAGDLLRQPPLT